MDNKLIGIIKRQTDYDINTIKSKLQKHNNNVESVLKEYHGIEVKVNESKNASTNQKIFQTIREFF